jgi:predicted RecA/RadA family phage recombinase
MGANGIADGNFGWALFQGIHPLTKVTAAAIAAGAQVVTGAAAVATIGANAQGNVVGYSPAAVAATNAGKYPIMVPRRSDRRLTPKRGSDGSLQ